MHTYVFAFHSLIDAPGRPRKGSSVVFLSERVEYTVSAPDCLTGYTYLSKLERFNDDRLSADSFEITKDGAPITEDESPFPHLG